MVCASMQITRGFSVRLSVSSTLETHVEYVGPLNIYLLQCMTRNDPIQCVIAPASGHTTVA